jgi:hypothetical protein
MQRLEVSGAVRHIYVIRQLKVNDDNTVINNNYGRLQDLTLLFKVPMGRQKYFSKIYTEFGHMPYKRFASPELDHNRRPFKTMTVDKRR